jgi:hypothetical protein
MRGMYPYNYPYLDSYDVSRQMVLYLKFDSAEDAALEGRFREIAKARNDGKERGAIEKAGREAIKAWVRKNSPKERTPAAKVLEEGTKEVKDGGISER